MDDQISIILVQIFQTQLAIKWLFMFPSHQTFVSSLPVENKTSTILIFIQCNIIIWLK